MTTTKVNLANTVEGILPVANGGTGTSTGVAPGGSTTQVQYNNAGAFGGSANLTFNGTTLTAAALTSTGVATFSAGTVSAPAITTSGDTNTGIFFPAADTIAFTEGGVEAMRITSEGTVGIGTTPQTWDTTYSGRLQIGQVGTFASFQNLNVAIAKNGYFNGNWKYTVNGTAALNQIEDNTFIWYQAASGTAGNNISWSERMRIDSSGNVGIGTSSPAAKLDVDQTTVGLLARFRGSDSTGRQLTITSSTTANTGDTYTLNSTGGSGVLAFATSNTERMRIASDGNLLVNTTTNNTFAARFQVTNSGENAGSFRTTTNNYTLVCHNTTTSGTVNLIYFATAASTNVGQITSNGTGVTYGTNSDYRLKENIAPMTGALDKVALLKPCTYTWKSNGSSGQGFIAHELQEVVPDAVVGEKDAVDEEGNIKPQGVDTSFLVATLTAAIQEQQQIINDLKARIETLEAK